MNEAQIEAIANADAHATNAGLPSYSDLMQIVQRIAAADVAHSQFAALAKQEARRAEFPA